MMYGKRDPAAYSWPAALGEPACSVQDLGDKKGSGEDCK